MPKPIKWASREKRRQVGEAVGKNFFKTLTEPLTNADSILKKQAGVAHASGLVEELLKLRVGDRANTAEIKQKLKKGDVRSIKVEVFTAGKKNRLCRVTDAGIGMSCAELEQKFGTYASAKAKGERTRSLFGRGALDVLLYHEEAVIYSVKDGTFSSCRIFWDGEPMHEAKEIGRATKSLLQHHHVPPDIINHGTTVQFMLKDGTHVPMEDQIIAKVSSFYMLRLIASDPNTEVRIERHRADGEHIGVLSYDFPLGTVIGRADDVLELKGFSKLHVNILAIRSDVPLDADLVNLDKRQNGLLFIDDNDAVLDLTLLPEHDRNPYLKHVYGFVRVTGLRDVLEQKLEADEAEAVLTHTREGFDRRNEVTHRLFAVVERNVKVWYEAEEKSQKQGSTKRSDALDQRISDALKAINEFSFDETEEKGDGDEKPEVRSEPIYFSVDSLRLHTSVPRRVVAFVNVEKVNEGEIVLFESDREEIRIEPDSSVVKTSKKQTYQAIPLALSCDSKGINGKVVGVSLDKAGREVRAELRVLGVDDAPLFEPPEDIAFTAPRYSGEPNRGRSSAALLVNLARFVGLPSVSFDLEDIEGNVTLADGVHRLNLQVASDHLMTRHTQHKVARVAVEFSATGWGQNAVLKARATRSDGKVVEARCKLRFERTQGDQKFSDFLYEDLDRPVLGDVAGDKLYVNSGYPLHREIFGDTEEDFHRSLEGDPKAQIRAVSVLVDTAVFHTATTKHLAGGKKGLHINPDDPIGSLRPYLDESRMKLERKVYVALVK